MDGWVKIHRKIIEHCLWTDKPFSRGQAWVDMLLMANHKDNDVFIDGKSMTIVRGSFHTSILKLSDRYGWERKKTTRFLNFLESEKMVTTTRTTHGTTVTIINYGFYQDNGQPMEQPMTQRMGQPVDNGRDTNKNDKNVKNEKKDNINYQQIADMYNNTCVSFPKLVKLSDTRKKAIKARLKTYNIEDFQKLFEMAEKSDFLKGRNDRNWSATFDWLIKDGNMAKVLENYYGNKGAEAYEKCNDKNRGPASDFYREFLK